MKQIPIETFLLDLLNTIRQRYTGIYDHLDGIRIAGLANRPDHIYMLLEEAANLLAQTICEHFNGRLQMRKFDDKEKLINESNSIFMMYHWRNDKKIYKFNRDLVESLIQQADQSDEYSIKIPADILLHLPYNGLFIEADIGYNIIGFITTLDYRDETYGLSVYAICDHQIENFNSNKSVSPLRLGIPLVKGKTIGECLDISTVNTEFITDKDYDDKDLYITKFKKYIKKIKMRILNVILYAIAANADIAKNPAQARIYKPRQPSSRIKDKLSEIESFDVGVNIGRTLRVCNESDNKDYSDKETRYYNTNRGSKKSPHIRCGHYHHYWVGKRDTPERKMILKWIPPTFIGGYTERTDIVSINPVE